MKGKGLSDVERPTVGPEASGTVLSPQASTAPLLARRETRGSEGEVIKEEQGVAGAQPMRGESEGCPLRTSFFMSRADKRDSA